MEIFIPNWPIVILGGIGSLLVIYGIGYLYLGDSWDIDEHVGGGVLSGMMFIGVGVLVQWWLSDLAATASLRDWFVSQAIVGWIRETGFYLWMTEGNSYQVGSKIAGVIGAIATAIGLLQHTLRRLDGPPWSNLHFNQGAMSARTTELMARMSSLESRIRVLEKELGIQPNTHQAFPMPPRLPAYAPKTTTTFRKGDSIIPGRPTNNDEA